jgi:hypothetical protein
LKTLIPRRKNMTSYYSKLLVSIPIFFVKNGTQFLDLGLKKNLKARFGSHYLAYFQVKPNPIMGSIGSHLVQVPKSKTSKFSM